MKKLLCLLWLSLMAAMALNTLAEGMEIPSEPDEPIVAASPVDEAAEEVEFELGGEPDLEAAPEENLAEDAIDGEAEGEPGIVEYAPELGEVAANEAMFSEFLAEDALPDEIEAFEAPEPIAESAIPEAQEAPALEVAGVDTGYALMAAAPSMTPIKLKISKRCTRRIFAGVPYQIKVRGRAIKGCTSRNPAVATVTEGGLLTPLRPGRAKITVKTRKKKIVMTVKVASSPAPTRARARIEGGAFLLSWDKARYATGYLIQSSPDDVHWTDALTVGGNVATANISAAVTGPGFFRVVTLLGDHAGGVSAGVSVLGPVRDLKVICEESFLQGPTDRLNITWEGTVGATAYNVYRATLPSEDYQLIGTTPNTFFADIRAATQLYAYRVQPVCGSIQVPLSAPVTLWTGMQDNVLPPANMTSETGIILVVNKQAQVVTAYGQDAAGAYTVPIRHMICSSGSVYDRTKNGTYTLKPREGEWYRYPSGVYIRYPSIYRDGYYFHSPLYSAKKHIMSGTVGKLGTRQSLGCIRLKMRDAQWVYENCPAGTRVYICDGMKRFALKKAIKPRKVTVKGF